jgi:hypothetical protein
MYINPFLAGMLVTVFIELVVFFGIGMLSVTKGDDKKDDK